MTGERDDPESQTQAKRETREGLTGRICFRYLMKEKKDEWLLREMGQMAGTENLLTLGDLKLFFLRGGGVWQRRAGKYAAAKARR